MQYIIVENRHSVLLGPINWKPRFIQNEFDDLEIAFTVPPVEQGYINVDAELGTGSATGIEIFPITDGDFPPFDPVYQYPAGPFWTFTDSETTMIHTVHDHPIDEIRSRLCDLVPHARWVREVSGTTLEISGTTVSLATDRDTRPQWVHLLQTIGTGTVNWKFPEGFVSVDVGIAQQIVNTVAAYVQAQFDWEAGMLAQIQAADTVDALKNLHITEIAPPPAAPQLPGASV